MSETERESKQEKNVEGGWSLFKSFQWYFCCAPCYAKNRRGEKQCVSFFSVVVFCVHTERGARVFFSRLCDFQAGSTERIFFAGGCSQSHGMIRDAGLWIPMMWFTYLTEGRRSNTKKFIEKDAHTKRRDLPY